MTLPTWISESLNDDRMSLRLALCKGKRVDFVMEIFPKRIKPHQGRSLEDAVLGLVASAYNYYPGTRPDNLDFNSYALNPATHGTTYPDYTLEQGALFTHNGEPLNAHRVVSKNDTITLPDGRVFASTLFSPSINCDQRFLLEESVQAMLAYFALPNNDTEEAFVEALIIRRRFYSIAMGAISIYLGTGYHTRLDKTPEALDIHPKDLVQAVMARANRLLVNALSGQQAFDAGMKQGNEFIESLIFKWILRPNRAWAPQTWEKSPLFDTMMNAADPIGVKAGQILAKTALEHALSGDRASKTLAGSSAHESLLILEGRDKVDEGLLTTCPLSWFKPRAASTARKLGNTITG